MPRYVPQAELGAILPLTSIGAMLGLPLAVIMPTLVKFLTRYMSEGEYGKVKSLLRDVFIASGVVFIVVSGLAYFLMPLVFTRVRVENGTLYPLIICAGIVGAVAPVFGTALQALKKFNTIAVFGFAGSVIRLITLLITLPIRSVSGYFLGQIIPSVFGILASIWALRKQLSRRVKSVAYWGEDWKAALGYTKWIALLYVSGSLQGTVEGLVIRHRLPDMDSAGFYMMSRFAEIATYLGMSAVVVMFPSVSARAVDSKTDSIILRRAIIGSFVFGVAVSCVLFFASKWVIPCVPAWDMYMGYRPLIMWLGILFTLRICITLVNFYEMAIGRFAIIRRISAVSLIAAVFMYAMFASSIPYTYFSNVFTRWLSTIKVDTLFEVLCVITLFAVVQFCIAIHAVFVHTLRKGCDV